MTIPFHNPALEASENMIANDEARIENETNHYVYILRCADESLYTGWTTDLTMRIKTHNEGNGAKYTRSRRPVVLAYYEQLSNKSDALKREHAIKKLTRSQKISLISGSAQAQKNERTQNDE